MIKATQALTLLFIALKLCSVIDWSWWWVLAPTWIPMTIAGGLLAFTIAVHVLLERKATPEEKLAMKIREYSKKIT